MKPRLAVIIPAYNEALVIASTLRDLRRITSRLPLPTDLVVVDDGSRDDTGGAAFGADYLLTHRKNCGLGAALMTGIEFARRAGYTYAITFDADGQHLPKDLSLALAKLQEGYDVVVGSRFLGTHSGMPRARRLLLALGNWITFLFFGVKTSDSQSGFRGLSRSALDSLKLRSNRMEVSSEFYGEIRRLHLKYTEIPIHVRYTAYSLKKGQSNSNGLKVLVKLLYQIIR